MSQDTAPEELVTSLGRELLAEVRQSPNHSRFSPAYYAQLLFEWASVDEEVKTSLFRLVDVVPSLDSAEQVVSHLQEYLEVVRARLPRPLQLGLDVTYLPLSSKVVAEVLKKQITVVARNFIVGASPEKSLAKLRKLRRSGLAFTIDLLGETSLSEEEAQVYLERYKDLFLTMASITSQTRGLFPFEASIPVWEEEKALVAGHRGEESPLNFSVKLSSLFSQSKAQDFNSSVRILSERLSELAVLAKDMGAYLYVDMEDSSWTDLALQTFKQVFSQSDLKEYARCGIVLQAYLKRSEQDLRNLLHWARTRNASFCLRLVKGAYWDSEVLNARLRGWPVPVFLEKAHCDLAFDHLARIALSHIDLVYPAFASHNIRSLASAMVTAETLGVDKLGFELQMLYGMAIPLKSSIAKRGYLVRDYAPIGELLPGMAYLVRRLLENTSNESFLLSSMLKKQSAEVLLAPPDSSFVPLSSEVNVDDANLGGRAVIDNHKFKNAANLDFLNSEIREQFKSEIHSLLLDASVQPFTVKPIVEGEECDGDEQQLLGLPENNQVIFSQTDFATARTAQKAIDKLHSFQDNFRDFPLNERTAILRRAASLMEASRAQLAASVILEVGKTWSEADAEISEAIDFLHYYAIQAEKLFGTNNVLSFPGEANSYCYEPRGVCAVISPWNFPLAIPCGMVAAALVTGNCCAFKPAEQSCYTAKHLVKTFFTAGLPVETLAFLPGTGEEIGPVITSHPSVSTILFTGSMAVGLNLNYTAAGSSSNALHVKRVITEMGGKNAIIVDDDADLDEAVRGVVASAFGYQGQKCSACSRVIVLEKVYERFLTRLLPAVSSLSLGKASDPQTTIGPVIDERAYRRIHQLLSDFSKTAKPLLLPTTTESSNPLDFVIGPSVFSDAPSNSPLLQDELFAPILHLERTNTFETAIAMAMSTRFALTGGVYSRSPRNIEYARNKFLVGNLYINRPCTGAIVGRQPFGGLRMSGVGSKAGGPDYLLQLVTARSISENTIRRGFAPD